MSDDLGTLVTFVFGEWDAPITDGAIPIEVPVTRSCWHCGEAFVAGDNGAIMPSGLAEHRECGLRAVLGGIGHHVNHERYCRSGYGPDAGLSRRQSSILVWARHHGAVITEEDLEQLRQARIDGLNEIAENLGEGGKQ